MATNYPTSLDTGSTTLRTDITATTELDDAGFYHDEQHVNAHGAVIAVETKLGVGSSDASAAGAGTVLVHSGSGSTGWSAAATGVTSVGTLSSLTVSGDVTVDTDTLHVDSTNDRVGIGTTSPSQELDVAGSIVISVGNGVMFDRSGTDLDVLFKETPTSTTYGTGDDVVLRNPNGANIRFQTNGTNDRMTINSAGRVGIGTTSPSYNLDVYGSEDTASRINISSGNTNYRYLMRFSRNGGLLSNGIYADTGTAYFGTPSDVNLKTGIETISTSDALAALNALRAVDYRYLLDADDVVRKGFIAQEVEEVIPEAVKRVGGGHPTTQLVLDENGDLQYKSVDENGDPFVQEEPDIILNWEPITTTLVAAVQELSATVQTLTARIEALEVN